MELRSPFQEHEGQIAIDLPGARALFTTRLWGDVRDTQTQIGERLGVRVVRAQQVHGDSVITVTAGSDPVTTEADALVTNLRGIAPAVITADCLPVVVASASAVAVVHAGWRGLDAGVIAKAVAELRRQGGGVLNAAIGPGAGVCCYEVAEELHRRFNARGQDFRRGPNLDLKAIARTQLMEAGVARIHDAGLCTICDDRQISFSYRREGAGTGRQAAIAWLT